MYEQITDEATARSHLNQVRDRLKKSAESLSLITDELVDRLVWVRPKGLLTVDEMAQAIGRDRNYVDSVWSAYGTTTKGRQTRVPVAEDVDPVAARAVYEELADVAKRHRKALATLGTDRAARDRLVAVVYGFKILGPSAIAKEVGIDRNHVLRLARKAGIRPVHRDKSRNQYTVSEPDTRTADNDDE